MRQGNDRVGRGGKRRQRHLQLLISCNYHGALDEICQFTNVSVPRIVRQHLHCFRRDGQTSARLCIVGPWRKVFPSKLSPTRRTSTSGAFPKSNFVGGRGNGLSKIYPWQETYFAAILETENARLRKRIDAAETNIRARVEELRMDLAVLPRSGTTQRFRD